MTGPNSSADQHSAPQSEQNRLAALMNAIPEHAEIRSAVRAAQEKSRTMLERHGLGTFQHTSTVHDYWQVEPQAFAMACLAETPEVRMHKACSVYLTHPIDDKFDKEEEHATRRLFLNYRNDLETFLNKWGAWGNLTRELINTSPHPELLSHGIRRIGYGGLLLHAEGAKRERLLEEYRTLSMRSLDLKVCQFIHTLHRDLYALTVKTTQEVVVAYEQNPNHNLAELWSIAYAPVLYYEDLKKERLYGEAMQSPAFNQEAMVEMISKAGALIGEYETAHTKRQLQLDFVRAAFHPYLPEKIQAAFKQFSDRLMASSNLKPPPPIS